MRARKQGTRIQMAVFVVAVLLFAYSAVASPLMFARGSLMLGSAAVGLSAAVPINPHNSLAEDLAEREAALNAREAQLRSESNTVQRFSEWLAPISLAASIVLFVLLAFNFYFDRRRNTTSYRVRVQ